MGEHLGDAPLVTVRPLDEALGVEPPDNGVETLVRGTKGL